jgi:hypothetical protein
MKTHVLLSTLFFCLIAGCGGGGGSEGGTTSSTDPATQSVLSSIQQKALAESQEPSSGNASLAGVQRNAQVLASTVLKQP